MSAPDNDYSAPAVSEYTLDPGGNYVSPGEDRFEGSGGTLSTSIIE